MSLSRTALFWILLFAVTVGAFPRAQAEPSSMAPATILVARVSGVVTVVDLETGQFRPLVRGMRLGQGVTINTDQDGSAMLLFSNGSTLTIQPGTRIAIDEYLQSPSAVEESPADLEKRETEPTTSKTRMRLIEGDVVGSVKQLNIEEGSSFEVTSPIGTAGIRGTTWIMSVRLTQDGATGQFGIADGFGYFIPLSGVEQLVEAGTEVLITLGSDDDGNLIITDVSAVGLSEEQRQQLRQIISNARQAFLEFVGDEFSSIPGRGQTDIGGQNPQQQQQNRERARPNRPADRVTPTQGEGATTRGPD